MNSPRISVILPTRNRLPALRRALNSLEGQTWRDFEVWLVDDGSTDGTGEFLESGQLQNEYPGIPSVQVLINGRQLGAAASRNRALDRAGGEFIAFLDDDDAWRPDYLESQLLCLAAHPQAAASYAACVQQAENGALHAPDMQPLFEYASPLIQMLTEPFVHSMSVFFCRRSVVDEVGLMDENLTIVHDWEWYARMLLSGLRFAKPGGPPLVVRHGPGGLVSGHRDWYREEIRVMERMFLLDPAAAAEQRHIRAHRALFFARTALRRKDFGFAGKRLAEAFTLAPVRSSRIALRRLYRNRLVQTTALVLKDQSHE